MTAARAFARTKPIVAYKAGRFPESAARPRRTPGARLQTRSTRPHRAAGIGRVFAIGTFSNCAELVAVTAGPPARASPS